MKSRMRSRKTTPFRWSYSCWTMRASKPVAVKLERLPLAVEPLHLHLRMARHQAPQIGDRQAPLPVVAHLARPRRHQRVDHHRQRDLRRTRRLVDEELHRHAHLRRGQPHPVLVAHALHHVVDQRLERRVGDELPRDRLRRRAQRRVAEAEDRDQSHDGGIIA